VVIVAFVVLDLVLVTLAFRHKGAEPESASRDGDMSQPSRAVSPSARHDEGRRDAEHAPVYAFLDGGRIGRILRASRGSCDGPDTAVVSVSTNAGEAVDCSRMGCVSRCEDPQVLGADGDSIAAQVGADHAVS